MTPSVNRAAFPLDFSLISFLIVDDQAFSRRLIRSMLHGFGCREVFESADGIEGLETAQTAMPHIIITDLIMPIFDGLRFLKVLKDPQSPTARIPIIVLSGYLTDPATRTMHGSGADELLVKPVSAKTLYDHIVNIVVRENGARRLPLLRKSHGQIVRPQGERSGTLALV
jgi:two-component system, chemotaxis family, chemotaxis protein CheY